MRSQTLLSLFLLLVLSSYGPAQRLIALGPSGWICNLGAPTASTCLITSSSYSLYEVDPGSAITAEIPLTPSTFTQYPFFTYSTAYDPASGQLFVSGREVGGPPYGSLDTIDAASGAIVQTVYTGAGFGFLEYETSTGRLLGITSLPVGISQGVPTLVQIDPVSGSLTPIGSGSYSLGQGSTPAWTAVDSATNRLFIVNAGVRTVDTITGTLVSVATVSPLVPLVAAAWDSSTNRLLALDYLGTQSQGPLGLVEIDPNTGMVTPLGPGVSGLTLNAQLTPYALDETRGLYHIATLSGPVHSGGTLVTFDANTGEILANPNIDSQFPLFNNMRLVVDVANAPLNGRVSLAPSNTLSPGGTTTVSFEALGHGGEMFLPFVSCTPGSFPIPGSSLVIPLAFDWCASLYFQDPAATSFFSLVPGGGLTGVLPAGGTVQGTVTLPNITATGTTLDLYITFLTLSAPIQWTGLHGIGILHVNL